MYSNTHVHVFKHEPDPWRFKRQQTKTTKADKHKAGNNKANINNHATQTNNNKAIRSKQTKQHKQAKQANQHHTQTKTTATTTTTTLTTTKLQNKQQQQHNTQQQQQQQH
tara:strand:- start:221 stop:550 length:330 start_codon:yes stop_codon:yes gene_type:complete